jgi:hypothetical protein
MESGSLLIVAQHGARRVPAAWLFDAGNFYKKNQ